MLNKSLPFKSVMMVLPASEAARVAPPRLPEGYGLRCYRPGDEAHWARIETSVLEFPDEAAALEYYRAAFLPHREELEQRCVFVTDPAGTPVATATAWYEPGEAGDLLPVLHWVSAMPDQQGKGLGEAAVRGALERFARLQPGRDIRLHTQTWSYPAIRLYRKLGFRVQRTGGIRMPDPAAGWKFWENDFDEAMAVLRPVIGEDACRDLVDTAL